MQSKSDCIQLRFKWKSVQGLEPFRCAFHAVTLSEKGFGASDLKYYMLLVSGQRVPLWMVAERNQRARVEQWKQVKRHEVKQDGERCHDRNRRRGRAGAPDARVIKRVKECRKAVDRNQEVKHRLRVRWDDVTAMTRNLPVYAVQHRICRNDKLVADQLNYLVHEMARTIHVEGAKKAIPEYQNKPNPNRRTHQRHSQTVDDRNGHELHVKSFAKCRLALAS